ncbi:unnamed protein product [Clavelina lepadiformis]|uniref:Uncharacterized protein n=1 Tax=Clavelina lepadiformis TaxID=159417 RepID=A0ABP0FJF5_CLALP
MKVENVQDKQNNDRIDAFISTKKYARFGESSASSRLLHVMQMARRQNIFPVYLSPPSAVRFNSFSQLNGSDKLSSKQSFNQHSKISHDELVRRRKLRLLKDRERKLKARKAMLTSSADSDDDPLKKAKDFISAISSQVGTFLEVVNKSILSSIKQEKKKMALQLEDMERKLRKNNMLLHAEKMKNKEYLSHVMEKSRKGIHTKFASIGHGKVHLLQHKTHQRLNHLQSSLTSVWSHFDPQQIDIEKTSDSDRSDDDDPTYAPSTLETHYSDTEARIQSLYSTDSGSGSEEESEHLTPSDSSATSDSSSTSSDISTRTGKDGTVWS